ncbi:MAG TPA: helix-turn-helix domain-containing protein [Draconibacterium sp.]|nr:helix-turn-helix domain-containing protein [Draconibacterium sp.]
MKPELPVNHRKSEKSIAVLPFVNMSTEVENEYFSDGITEEIINALTKIRGLRVIARTSSFAFKGKHIDIREIGNQLGVSSVLEGSVRKIQNRVRITAQLINAEDGTHFWSKNFDRELQNIFELQDEISLLISNQIRENFGHFNIQEHLVNAATSSMPAYELFLKGRYHQLRWDADSIHEATKYYEASVAEDPKFARAYYGLVQSYGLLAAWGYMPAEEGFEKAFLNLMIAQDLDKTLPEYGQSYIGKTFWMDWDFQATYDQLTETLQLHPRYAEALEAMGELFLLHGNYTQAEKYIKKALDFDPVSANHHYTLGNINYYQRQFENALRLVEKALYINSDFVLAYELKVLCLIGLNRREEFDEFVSGHENTDLKTLLFEVMNEGKQGLSPETIDTWQNAAEDKGQLIPYELYILANSDYKKEALALLKKYIAQKRGQIINYRVDPLLEPLREYDEFHSLHSSNLKFYEELSEAEQSSSSKSISPELETLMQKLLDFIEAEKPYLDAQLSLGSLAESLDLHPNKLSYLINEKTNMNFNEFINQFRLANFKEISRDPKNSHLTILGLAYESGFNSKTVFNAYFKKMENTTPGNWLKEAKQ